MTQQRLVLPIFFLCFGLAGAGYLFFFQQPPVEKDLRAQYLKAGDFELSYENQPFKLSSLKGKPLILYFGYTSCPDVCPLGLGLIRDVLNSDKQFKDIPAVFVTLDPKRDTADVLKSYTEFFHPNIVPLTGSFEEIRSVAEAYGGFVMHAPLGREASEDTYRVDHSAYYYLIDANNELVRVFDHQVQPKEIASVLRRLL